MDFIGSDFSRLPQLLEAGGPAVRHRRISSRSTSCGAVGPRRRVRARGRQRAAPTSCRRSASPRSITTSPRSCRTGPDTSRCWQARTAASLPVRVTLVDGAESPTGRPWRQRTRSSRRFRSATTCRSRTTTARTPANWRSSPCRSRACSPSRSSRWRAVRHTPYTLSVVLSRCRGRLAADRLHEPLGSGATGADRRCGFAVQRRVRCGGRTIADRDGIDGCRDRRSGAAARSASSSKPLPIMLQCDPDLPPIVPGGRVVAALFSEEVTPATSRTRLPRSTSRSFTRRRQSRRRRAPFSPAAAWSSSAFAIRLVRSFARTLTVTGVADVRGRRLLAPDVSRSSPRSTDDGGVVSGHVLDADGTPVPFANVRLFYLLRPAARASWAASAPRTADADGRFGWDFVLRTADVAWYGDRTDDDEFRDMSVHRSARRSAPQRERRAARAAARYQGRTPRNGESRWPARSVKVTSLTDQSQYGTTTDADGNFTIARIPVGNVFVEAVNVAANAQTFISQNIPLAGATTAPTSCCWTSNAADDGQDRHAAHGHVLRVDGAAGGRSPGVCVLPASEPAERPLSRDYGINETARSRSATTERR